MLHAFNRLLHIIDMATVEQLYKNFGVLADAKDKAGEVSFNQISTSLPTKVNRTANRVNPPTKRKQSSAKIRSYT